MSRFFAIDAPLVNFLRKLAYLVILNLLFWISCLPVITIGAACSALYGVTFQGLDDNPVREYVRIFKRDFRQATPVFLLLVLTGGFIYLDFSLARSLAGSYTTLITTCFGCFGFLLVMVASYVFPLISRTDNTLKGYYVTAFQMAVKYLPRSVLMGLLNLLPVGAILLFPYQAFKFGYLILLFAFAFLAQINARLLRKGMAPYLPPKPSEPEEDPSEEGEP